MEEIQYIGETLWPGQLGHFFIILSCVAAIYSSLAFLKATQENKVSGTWAKMGKLGFFVHGFSIFGVIALIFYVMVNKHYEYAYAFNHVSDDLPMRYILSSFWEGQEGSFLLWMFWHIILGFFIICFRKSEFQAPVVGMIALVQFVLTTMILGIYLPFGEEGFKLGSNPLLLLRDTMQIPLFNNADYLSLIEGQGLNPTLQNYWMTIHPPTLFLGFASTVVPFAYAVAALYTRKHTAWLKPALQWGLFSGAILGLGILMGGAWAYEALSFGGYWAWDPVENMSLVPWIILVGGIHTNLVAKHTGYSIKTTYLFYILTFVMILYSTFLTRSGILGDTSVHAFTEMGLEKQLVFLITFFLGIGLILLIMRSKEIPAPKKEESIVSREFWMLIGSIILFFSAALISGATSLPVFNTIMKSISDPNYVGLVITDPMEHFNKYQLWIAVFIGLLSGLSQFLRYKGLNWDTYKRKFLTYAAITLGLSAIGTLLLSGTLVQTSWQINTMLFAGIFAVLANLVYIISVLRGNLKLGASAFSHLGFGLLIFGILYTGLNKSYITSNPFAFKGIVEDDKLASNIQLIKHEPIFSEGYWINYHKDSLEGNNKFFDISFTQVDENKKVKEHFDLRPYATYSNDFTKVANWNPSTRRYWNKDIFVNVTGYPKHLLDIKNTKELEDTLQFEKYEATLQDTFYTKQAYGKITEITFAPTHPDLNLDEVDAAVGVTIELDTLNSKKKFYAQPVLALEKGLIYQYPVTVDPLHLKVKLADTFFDQVFTQDHKLDYTDISLTEGQSTSWDGYTVTLAGFDKNPTHKNYEEKEGDIAIGSRLVLQKENERLDLRPLYIIRDGMQFNVKDYDLDSGIHARFTSIDPKSKVMSISLARDDRNPEVIPLEIADKMPRSDVLALQATVFPGINLVWLGCLLMLFGMAMSLWLRYKKKIGA